MDVETKVCKRQLCTLYLIIKWSYFSPHTQITPFHGKYRQACFQTEKGFCNTTGAYGIYAREWGEAQAWEKDG